MAVCTVGPQAERYPLLFRVGAESAALPYMPPAAWSSPGKTCVTLKTAQTRILFQREDIPGFNDLFTDPKAVSWSAHCAPIPFKLKAQVPGELWRLAGEDSAVELYGDVGITNGIGFSPDGSKLYHSDSVPRHIILHDVAADGSMTNRRILASLPA